MSNVTTVYKVVRETPEGLVSVIAKTPALRVAYPVLGWAKPPLGLLFAFQSLSNAQWFANKHSGTTVWKAEPRGVKHLCLRANAPCTRALAAEARRFWNLVGKDWRKRCYQARWSGLRVAAPIRTPKGTVGCEAIRLLERVE